MKRGIKREIGENLVYILKKEMIGIEEDIWDKGLIDAT